MFYNGVFNYFFIHSFIHSFRECIYVFIYIPVFKSIQFYLCVFNKFFIIVQMVFKVT